MAPTAPKKRPSIRAKAKTTTTPSSGSGLSLTKSTASNPTTSTSSFLSTTKKDKRISKTSSFLHRIEKSHSKPLSKRRRPNKKLKTTLEDLADALPDVESLVAEVNNGLGKMGGGEKIKMKSLKSKPGAMKRKEKLEKMERERFGKNLAMMMSAKQEDTPVIATAGDGAEGKASTTKAGNRFAALRAWAEQNMEKHPGFQKTE